MSENQARHRLLLRFQAKVLKIVAPFVIAAVCFAGGIQYGDQRQVQQEIVEAQQRSHFWRVIAGTEPAGAPTVDNRLAKDIKDRLGPIDSGATELPEAINRFRGNSNSYGGITDAIGTDPFDEAGLSCVECGPLDGDTKTKLLLIKQGNVEDVIASETPAQPGGYTLTPFGWSGLKTGLVIWLTGGPLVLLAAHRWAYTTHNQYTIRRFGDLEWSLNGECDATKLTTIALAPSWFIPYLAWRAATNRRFERRVRSEYGGQMAIVDEVDRVLDRISLKSGDDPRVQALQQSRDTLVAELKSLTRAQADGSIEDLLERTCANLDDAKSVLKSRNEALADINQQDAYRQGGQGSLGQ